MSTWTLVTLVPRASETYEYSDYNDTGRYTTAEDLYLTLADAYGEAYTEYAFGCVYLYRPTNNVVRDTLVQFTPFADAVATCTTNDTTDLGRVTVYETDGDRLQQVFTYDESPSDSGGYTYTSNSQGRLACATAYVETGVYALPHLPRRLLGRERSGCDTLNFPHDGTSHAHRLDSGAE